MQNQAAVQALYSQTLIENYLDSIENFPNALQLQITRIRELDILQQKDFYTDLEHLCEALENTSAAGQRTVLRKVQHALIAAQDLGDDKLSCAQAMTDMIDSRTRQLDHDSENLDFGRDLNNGDGNDGTTSNNIATEDCNVENNGVQQQTLVNSSWLDNKNKIKSVNEDSHYKPETKQAVKRRKRKQSGNESAKLEESEGSLCQTINEERPSPPPVVQPRDSATANSAMNVKRSTTKRKTSRRPAALAAAAASAAAMVSTISEVDIDINNVEIDPDEPTYCLCDQISYGDMIGCDNDLCPIEWFHFNCVQLSVKPKGKWFCPKCRGDRPTVMKPKAQFLKELERFNREREEKLTKHPKTRQS